MITADTSVARVLEDHPALLEFLAAYHPHFEKLRDPQLRRLMAGRVTVAEAARIVGVDTARLVADLRHAAGEPASAPPVSPVETAERPPKPPALADVPETRLVRLDVREGIGRGEEPFAAIMAAVARLAPEQALVLRVPFEPIPLYDVLGKRGFAHWAERHGAQDWSVWFYPGAPTRRAGRAAGARRLDVRGLEPPMPMVTVLEGLETLAPGEELEVVHDRRPLFLYPQLDERGFEHRTEEAERGVVRILIRRPTA
jgi:TusA-related sulfurtransferase